MRAGPPSRGGSRISAAMLGALDRAQVVDDSLRVRLGRADLGEVAAQQVRDDDPAALVAPRARSSARASSFSFANCTDS